MLCRVHVPALSSALQPMINNLRGTYTMDDGYQVSFIWDTVGLSHERRGCDIFQN